MGHFNRKKVKPGESRDIYPMLTSKQSCTGLFQVELYSSLKNAAYRIFAARQVSPASVSIILFFSLDARQCIVIVGWRMEESHRKSSVRSSASNVINGLWRGIVQNNDNS
jgi:hypothetical protein